jgi:antitoxin PrlF
MSKYVSPTVRGQITIPTEVRKKLQITPKTKFKVYIDNNKVVFEPVSTIDLLLRDLETEARVKGYTREELDREIDVVREKLMNELY